MATKRQWQGYVTAKTGTLIGGGKTHRSIWFNTKKDALSWTKVVVNENRKAHRDVGFFEVTSRTAKKVWY